MITIKSIAKEANVSEGTVDRVLHERGGVSQKTEAKIRKILKKHNFKVNPVARALALKKKLNLLTLMPNYNDDNLFWKSPYLGILKASAEVKNYGVAVHNFFFDQFDPNSYLNQFEALMDAKPSAVVIVPTFTKETKQIVDRLDNLEIPYLFFNIDLEGFDNISFIGQDSYMGGYVAGKMMHLILSDPASSLIIQSRLNVSNYYAISKRIEGFNDYFIKNNIDYESLTLSIDNLSDASYTKRVINSFLKKNKNIKGLFVPSSRIATIVEAIDKVTLSKLRLIGFDNTEQNLQCLEDETVSFLISQKPFEQGYESIRLMTDFLVKNKKPSSKMYSPIDILTKENARYNERNEREFEDNEH